MRKSELFDAYLSNSLTPEQAEELKKVLKTESGSSEFMHYVTESQLMCDILEKNSELDVKESDTPKKKKTLIPFIIATAIAASIAIFALIQTPSKTPSTVTIIEKGVKKDVLLSQQKVYKTEDIDNIILPDGTAVQSRGTGQLIVKDKNNVSISKGIFTFQVKPRKGQTPFRIQMSHATIEVIGTAFDLVDNHEMSSITVSEGIVKFIQDNKEIVLKAGDSAQANKDSLVKNLNDSKGSLELSIDGKYTNDKAAFRDTSGKNRTGWASWDKGDDGAVKQIVDQGNAAIAFSKSGRLGIKKFELNGPFSLNCWVKPNGKVKEFQTMISNGNSSWRLSLDKDSLKPHFAISGLDSESITASRPLVSNQWHLVSAVYTGSSLKLYIDGILDSQINTNGTIGQYKGNIEVGGNHEAWGRNFEGALDGVQIYSRSQSDLDILKLFQQGRP